MSDKSEEVGVHTTVLPLPQEFLKKDPE